MLAVGKSCAFIRRSGGAHMYSVYLLYWYKSTVTKVQILTLRWASLARSSADLRRRGPTQFTCFTGTKVQTLTLRTCGALWCSCERGALEEVERKLPIRHVDCGGGRQHRVLVLCPQKILQRVAIDVVLEVYAPQVRSVSICTLVPVKRVN
jgi:hypothetical protein